jgi:hypothetical protein
MCVCLPAAKGVAKYYTYTSLSSALSLYSDFLFVQSLTNYLSYTLPPRPAAAFHLLSLIFSFLTHHLPRIFPLYNYRGTSYPTIRSQDLAQALALRKSHLQDAPQHSSSSTFLRHPKRLVSDSLLLTSDSTTSTNISTFSVTLSNSQAHIASNAFQQRSHRALRCYYRPGCAVSWERNTGSGTKLIDHLQTHHRQARKQRYAFLLGH